MGKKLNLKEYINCQYCGKRFEKQDMIEKGYLYRIKTGELVFECTNTKCNSQQLVKE